MRPLLDVRDLRVSFRQRKKKVEAVRGVDFKIYPRETIAVVGESGCGKSVMVKSLLKLFSTPCASLDSGAAFFNCDNLFRFSEKKMREIRGKEIGMIFQDPMSSLNPTLKIGRQIVEGLRKHYPETTQKMAHERAIELLTLVGIPQPELRLTQYPHELSGGMRQRIMIALALAPSPKILIADEPTTALDVTIQAQILALLKEIQAKTGTSILFITHDLSIVANFCDRVLVMYAGKIVEAAPVHELFKNPKHPYTKKLLRSIPRIDLDHGAPLTPIEGSPPDLSRTMNHCSFFERCDERMHICYKRSPPLFELDEDSRCACFLYDRRRKNEENPS
ncbi:MAG: Oligopeptide transport ATP-binding protein OppD [Chlamydiia bacterium]|nr:Oligopeptide transport ATP-binding protein OppD [Chlamydiia bacterium]